MIGEKIKALRNENKMTQKDLANKLFVTSQAVSRWENGEVEPSISTITELAKIFNITVDDLINSGIEEKENSDANRQVLCICEKCNKPIYDQKDIRRFTRQIAVRNGRSYSLQQKDYVYCSKCDEQRMEEEKRESERIDKERKNKAKKRRIASFIVGTIIAAVFIVFSIICFTKPEGLQSGLIYLGLALIGFTLSSCFILNNTFITDLWFNIAETGFVKMPGVIFEFSLDGFIVGILIKVFLTIISYLIAFIFLVIATLFTGVLSIFVYPFALKRNYAGIIND